MIRPCTFVRFGQPVMLDVREDPRTTIDCAKEATRYDSESGHVIIQRATEWLMVIPPPGSVIRGVGQFEAPTQQPATVNNGQQQPAPSDSPPPARPVQKSGRVQR